MLPWRRDKHWTIVFPPLKKQNKKKNEKKKTKKGFKKKIEKKIQKKKLAFRYFADFYKSAHFMLLCGLINRSDFNTFFS